MFGLNTIFYGGLVAVLIYLGTLAYSFPHTIEDLSAANASLRRDLALRDSREASLRRLIQRRDDAIEASKCKTQIKKWLKNPDLIPKKFCPFGQLGEAPGC